MRKILIFVLYQNLTLTIAYLIPRLGFLTIPSIDETGIVLVMTIEKKPWGVAIYMRNNLKVKSIIKSERFEGIALEIELRSGHGMLMCGLYHPPRAKYLETDLIDYLIDTMDNFQEENHTGLIVCGGDLNHLDLERLTTMSGLKVLVDFPTRGSSILDNCLTNNENLFHKCYSVIFQMKTDHKCVVLPSGIKLKPVRFMYKMHDYREHRIVRLCFDKSSWITIGDILKQTQMLTKW